MLSYEINNVVRLSGSFVDESGTYLDPTAVFVDVVEPDGTETTYEYGTDAELVKDSTGNYHIDVTVDAVGTWEYTWYSTGTGTASNTEYVYVYSSVTNIHTLFDMALNVARTIYDVIDGSATSAGTTTTLTDTALLVPRGEYNRGCIFFTSGIYAYNIARITSIIGTTITFTPAFSNAVPSGTTYAVAPCSKESLLRAVNQVLRSYSTLKNNTDITVVADQEEYNLPAGVSSVVRVEIAQEDASPYDFQANYYWTERNGKLIWDVNYVPSETEGNIIRIWYNAPHGELTELTNTLDSETNLEFVKWEAIVNILRSRLRDEKRDDPVLVDLLNEAKTNSATEKMKQRSMPKDVRIL